MIGYVLVGSNDLPRAKAFYDTLLALNGAKPLMDFPTGGRVYGRADGTPMFGVTPPYDGNPATIGNGTMISFQVETRADVDALYAKGLELGGKDEGAPGVRGEDGPQAFYGAYFRDLDGNKLCAFRIGGA